MMFEVSNKIRPLISRMNAAETAKDSAGMENRIAPIPAKNATTMPAVRKPDIKLKSLPEAIA